MGPTNIYSPTESICNGIAGDSGNMKKEKGKKTPREAKRGVKIVAQAKLPTEFGEFVIVAFCNGMDGQENVALIKGVVRGKKNVLVRMHSECLTGDAFHSLRCDCNAQLHAALKKINKKGTGAIVYLRQEGRGIGITNKIRAYALQDKGLDTVQANLALGLPADGRNYQVAAEMIKKLGIKSVNLITNNPDKIARLLQFGIRIARRVPHEFGKTKYNREYLKVKKNKMSHLLS